MPQSKSIGDTLFTQSSDLFAKRGAWNLQPMKTWKEFINQRIRWASKAGKYQDKRLFPVLLLVYLFNLLFAVVLGAATPASAQGFKWWQTERFQKELALTSEQITRIEGKWKTSQNRPEADRVGVAKGLREAGEEAMAALVARRF